jgi:hypothetical protein
MAAFLDKLEVTIGAELSRPAQSYIAKYVCQPVVVHDFAAVPGTVVRMKRYGFWNDDTASYTETARKRTITQIIGTGDGRAISQEPVTLVLNEYTGPSAGDVNDPSRPGTLKIPMFALLTAQRNMYNLSTPDQFHDSIGSRTLIEDYRKWQDRVYINLFLNAFTIGAASGTIASATSGGYYNPSGIANGGTYNANTGVPRIDFVRDIAQVVSDARTRLVPPFPTAGQDLYHCLCSPNFMLHLRQDPEFRKVAQYPGIPGNMLYTPNVSSAPVMPPVMPWTMTPNQLIQAGGFAGQTGYLHQQMMPQGVVYEGVRFFETTNMPTSTTTLTYSGLADQGYADGSGVSKTGYQAILLGKDTIGEGGLGVGPEVLLNNNDDFRRFIIAIWRQYSGYTVLMSNNITILRTFIN